MLLLLLKPEFIGDFGNSLFDYFVVCKSKNERDVLLEIIPNEDIKSNIRVLHVLFIDYGFRSEELEMQFKEYFTMMINRNIDETIKIENNLNTAEDFITFYQKSFYQNIIKEGKDSEIYQEIMRAGNQSFTLMASNDVRVGELLFIDNLLSEYKGKATPENQQNIDNLWLKRHLLAYDISVSHKEEKISKG